MKRGPGYTGSLSLLLALCLFALAKPVQAQLPESEEAFVYGVTAVTPGELLGTCSPPQVEEIYLLADRVSVLSPRQTQVYFWPLTREYRPGWSQLNEPVDGVLEIMQHSRVVETVELEPYTAHYKAAGMTTGRLYVGDEATEVESRFQAARKGYRQAISDYRQARQAWLDEGRARQDEAARPPLRPEPQPPPALDLYSIGLHVGFPVALEAGLYRIRMRDTEGQIVTGSQRTLRVFEPRRSAIGYEIIPEDRWTYPEQVNAITDVVVAKAGSVVYLRPRLVHEVPALAYERLRDAQFKGETGAPWRWVAEEGEDAPAHAVLEIVRDGVVVDRLAQGSYYVSQAYDRERGYEILPFNPGTPDLTPRVDFDGFRLEMPLERDSFVVRLEPQLSGPQQDSARHVRVMPHDPLPVLFAVALLPVALGLLAFALRYASGAPEALVRPDHIPSRS